jgi:hypothetical protein
MAWILLALVNSLFLFYVRQRKLVMDLHFASLNSFLLVSGSGGSFSLFHGSLSSNSVDLGLSVLSLLLEFSQSSDLSLLLILDSPRK